MVCIGSRVHAQMVSDYNLQISQLRTKLAEAEARADAVNRDSSK
jgi:hypothetical protein